MYSPANSFFSSQNAVEMVHPDHVHTMYTIQHFLHAIYFRCYTNYMIEENDKLCFIFSHIMFYCYLFLKIAS